MQRLRVDHGEEWGLLQVPQLWFDEWVLVELVAGRRCGAACCSIDPQSFHLTSERTSFSISVVGRGCGEVFDN
jgi:hypothetical protein